MTTPTRPTGTPAHAKESTYQLGVDRLGTELPGARAFVEAKVATSTYRLGCSDGSGKAN